MITQKYKGGEFYAESTCEHRAMCTKWRNSSIEQHEGVVDTSMLIVAAARIATIIRAFSFAPELPRSALDSSFKERFYQFA